MSTLEERLRDEMAQAVAAVRPVPDPYARLLRRRRRRSWRWGGTSLGAALVAGVVGLQLLLAPAGPSPSPDPRPTVLFDQPQDGPLDRWGRDLIAAATRGDAAKADPALAEALARALDNARGQWSIRPALDRIKVLYIVDVGGSRAFAAAYYNDDRAQFVAANGPAGSSAEDLVSGRYGLQSGPLEPFTLGGDAEKYTVAMAPPGCLAAPSLATRVGPDSALQQTWATGAEFTVDPKPALNRWWKVSCDGVVRELLAAGGSGAPPAGPPPPAAERGQADPALVEQLLQSWPELPGLEVTNKRIVYGGTPEYEHRPTVVGIGDLGDGSVMVVADTGEGASYLVTAVKPDPSLEAAKAQLPPARITTAVSPRADIVAVRLPADDHVSLSDRFLVIAPRNATELLSPVGTDGQAEIRVTLHDGVGVLHTKPAPGKVSIRAYDAQHHEVAALTVAEPRDAPQLLAGQALVRNWG
ncbi:hypothetical protein [Dactylosporangium sp. CA-139066]|uniref:hypothetical protein n=1 Tax=Dactylosporangium sp. CA-139066 TaxID=3239930 RepID=UPI003D8A0832